MNFIKEYAPRGSDFYYSILSLKEPKRQQLIALYAYATTLNHIAERYHDANIAKTKLLWWQSEIERLYQGQAQHPITQHLPVHLSKTALLAMIEAAQLSLETQRFDTQAQLAQHYQHTGGIVLGLMTQVLLGEHNEVVEKYAHTLGVALETIRHIIDMPYHFARQHVFLPMEQIPEAELAGMLTKPKESPLLKKILAEQANYTKDMYQAALTLLSPAHANVLKPLHLYAKLRLANLKLIEKEGFRVFEHHLALSPLRKLWMTM